MSQVMSNVAHWIAVAAIGLGSGWASMQNVSAAEVVSRESDIGELRLGQRIQVDDGMCPAGQIKEVSGAQLNSAGVARVVRCVPRQGSRR